MSLKNANTIDLSSGAAARRDVGRRSSSGTIGFGKEVDAGKARARRQSRRISLINPNRLSTSCRRASLGSDPLARATITKLLPTRSSRPWCVPPLLHLGGPRPGPSFFKRVFSSVFTLHYARLSFCSSVLLLFIPPRFRL